MLASMLLTLIGVILVGLALTALAVRGKRLNTHPTCRSCNFDLSQSYPASPTCPECGAGLKRDRAVRIGQRARRPVVLAIGLILTLTPLIAIGIAAFAALTGTDLNHHKPLAMLIWEAGFADAKTSKVIATELHNRMLTNLDADEQQRVIALALQRQADEKRPWDQTWGQIVDQARISGTLNKPDLQQFLNNAVVPKLTARRRVAQGGTLPLLIESECRAGSSWQSTSYLWSDKVELGGHRLRRVSSKGLQYFTDEVSLESKLIRTIWVNGGAVANADYNTTVLMLQLPPEVPLGVWDLEFELSTTGKLTSSYSTTPDIKPDPADPAARRWSLKVPVEVVPAEDGGVTLIPPDPQTTAKLEKLLRPAREGGKALAISASSIELDFWIKDLPVPVAYEVHLRTPDGTKRLGTFSSGHQPDANLSNFYQGNPSSRTISKFVRDIQPGKIELILKPAPKYAAKSIDLTSIYGGEITLKDLELIDPYQQKSPAPKSGN